MPEPSPASHPGTAKRPRKRRKYGQRVDGKSTYDKHAPAPGSTKVIPKITCQECGKQMLRITQNHLTRSHDGMLYEDYLKKYGPHSTTVAEYNHARGGTTARALVNDPEMCLAIYDLAQKGYHHKTIAATVGISPSTIEQWLTKGKPDNVDLQTGERLAPDVYYEFVEQYRKHEALAETQAVDSLVRASTGDWKAAVAYLERRFPEHWRLATSSSSTVKVEGQVDHVHVRDVDIEELLKDPETAQMACTLLERLSGGDRQPNEPNGEMEVIDAEAVDLDEE